MLPKSHAKSMVWGRVVSETVRWQNDISVTIRLGELTICPTRRWASAHSSLLHKPFSVSSMPKRGRVGGMSVTGLHQLWLTVIYTTEHFEASFWRVGSPQLVVFSPVSALLNVLPHIIASYLGRSRTHSTVQALSWIAFNRLLRHSGAEEG